MRCHGKAAGADDASAGRAGTYIALSFGLAWAAWIGCWVASTRGVSGQALVPLVIAGSFGPFVASGVSTFRSGGLSGVLGFYRRGLEWRMGWSVFLVSLLLLPALGITTAALFAVAQHQPFTFLMKWEDLPLVYLLLLVMGGPLAEEFGWSHLSDRLDTRLPLYLSTIVLGLIWALWHLPLFFLVVPGLEQKYIPFAAFALLSVAARFIFSWTYHRSGLNILSNLLIHNGLNLALNIVPIVLPVVGDLQPRLWVLSAMCGLCAALLWRLAPLEKAVSSPEKRSKSA